MGWTTVACAHDPHPKHRRTALRLPAVLAAICAVVLVAGCGSDQEAAVSNPGGMVYEPTQDTDGFRGVGLTRPYRMPDITLTDSSGAPYNLVDDTTKPVTLVFFGYTNCPDVCGLVMADMASAMTRLEPQVAARVQPLFVTTDPARDTPSVVKEYVDRFHPAFEGLTGPMPKIKAAAAPLGVPIEGRNRLPSGGYEVGHGSQIIGFTADDKAHVVWTQGTPVEDLVADIHALAHPAGVASTAMILASIPSPDQGTWQIGFFELRAYALCIIAGVLVAVWLGNRRWVARGGRTGTVADIAVWAVPFGLVGARLYHVLTDYQLYFCSGCHPVEALYIWRGGLGIWGAVSLGAVGAYIGCRRRGVRFLPFGDAVVPAIAVAQGIGRFGNWFNQELFGQPTTLPWALQIDPAFRPEGYGQFATFHPTFLYEALWDFGIAGLLILLDRRFRLGHGRVIALYVMFYTAGRGWIEMLRIDEANVILGLRLNVWTSILVFLAGLVFFVWSARKHPGREQDVQPAERPEAAVEAADPAAEEPAGEEPPAEATPAEATRTKSRRRWSLRRSKP